MGDPVKKYKAKQFRVAVAGKTIDGREITEQQISDMAATYNTSKYQARIWLEHIRGYAPDSMFGAYGDVLQVEAKRDPTSNILGLYATIEPLPAMVKITTELKQKIFSSIEINPNFQNTGRAYLEGLAFTDSPASTGCDVLQFSLKADAARRPDRLFSIPAEIEGVQFEEATASTVESLLAGLTTAVSNFTALFSSQQQPATPPATPATPQPVTATAVADLFSKLADVVKDHAAKFTEQHNEMAKLRTELDELKTQFNKIDHQPSGQQRPPATGGAPSGNAYSGM